MNGSPTLKLLLVSGVFPPAIGGPSLQTKQIAQGLIAQAVTVQVVTYGDPQRSGIVEGVPVTFLDDSPQRHWGSKLWRNLRVFRDLNQIIHQMQPSVIHMQTAAGNLAFMTGLAARWHRIPSLLKYTADLVAQKATVEDFERTSGWPHRLRHWANQHSKNDFQQLLFQLYQGIWATTPAFQSRLQQHYRVAPEKCWLLPNFIDLQPFAAVAQCRSAIATPSKRALELLTVARLFPVKGLDVYLRALAQLHDLPIRARIVGSGSAEYRQYLQALAAALGLSDRVAFTGAIEPEQVAAAYAAADVFVLPSRHEPFGIVLIEAMAAGLPVVATQVDGIPYVVEAGRSALLVPPGDVDSLAIAIRTLVQSADQRQTLAAAGRKRAQSFALDPGLQTLMAIYQSLDSTSVPVAPQTAFPLPAVTTSAIEP